MSLSQERSMGLIKIERLSHLAEKDAGCVQNRGTLYGVRSLSQE